MAYIRTVEAADTAQLLAALETSLNGGPPVLALPAGRPREALLAAVAPERALEYGDIAALVPTSGSTGAPKPVLLPRRALVASAAASADRLGGAGQWVLALAPTHIGGLQVLIRSVVAGTSPVVAETSGGFRAESFVAATAAIHAGRRYTSLVPTQLHRLLEAGAQAREALCSYDAVLLGGAGAPAALLAEARAAGVKVVTTYGMSETCGGCVYDGVALDGVRWELAADARIRLGGPVLARGYRLLPDLSAAAFDDDWFRTQDVGERTPDGRLRVLGRVDDVIVTGGVKVAALAVEEALLTHPSVREAAVVGVSDEEWGQRVVGVVVVSGPVRVEALREHVTAALGRESAPRTILLVDGLPTLAPGKLDRAALAALAAAAG